MIGLARNEPGGRTGMDAKATNGLRARTNEPLQVEERVLAAVADERERLAADLHDSIGGTLAGVVMGLSALQRSMPNAATREKLADLTRALDRGLAEIRTFSFGLQFPWCEPGGSLEIAIAQFATGFGRRAGLKVSVEVAPLCGALGEGAALALVRVLQEALLNVHRHAMASSVTVSLARYGQAAKLTVQDDGRGMDLREGVGVGLVAMRDRIRRFGGVLQIESGRAGTTISASVPFLALAA
jgi:signal transduction histidine kinase